MERFGKSQDLLDRHGVLVIPQKQLDSIPGMTGSEICNFDLFNQSIKPTHSIKKDLQIFFKKRQNVSISNLKLPNVDGSGRKIFKPHKNRPGYDQSESLFFRQVG
jgi:hypothetical protein